MDDNVLTRIGDALGAVAQADLHLNRTGRRRLQALVDAGELKRYPHGIVALPGTDRRILIARLHRGLITCEHAAAYYGLPLPSPPRSVHVLTPQGRRLPPLWGEHRHETRGRSVLRLEDFPVVSLARCIADLLCCAEEWTALVAADAALHRGRTTRQQVSAYLRGPRRVLGRNRLKRTSDRARSPLETLARVQLQDAGIDISDGMVISDVGEVDLVVAGWLVIELDGYEFHSDRWPFHHDRERDRELVRQGYTPIRFTSNNVRSGKIVTDVQRILSTHP